MARTKDGTPFHPTEYDPDYPRVRCINCGRMNSCKCENTKFVSWFPRFPILMNGGMIESVTHDDGLTITINEYTTHSLQKIIDTPLTLYPTQMLMMNNFIHPELYQKLKENWPTREILKEQDEPKGRFQFHRLDFNEYYEILYNDVLNNINVKCAIVDKFGLEWDLKSETQLQIWEDTINFSVNDVHIDFEKFDITFGLYMPDDDSLSKYGTEFWSPNQYTNNLDYSFRKEECDYIRTFPFIPNNIYFMPRTNRSWHSSPNIDKKIIRKHIYGFYERI
jgi:hypothetical protein